MLINVGMDTLLADIFKRQKKKRFNTKIQQKCTFRKIFKIKLHFQDNFLLV